MNGSRSLMQLRRPVLIGLLGGLLAGAGGFIANAVKAESLGDMTYMVIVAAMGLTAGILGARHKGAV